MPRINPAVWYTADEKKFIRNLGIDDGDRLSKLIKYKKSMKGRVHWGIIDRKLVKKYVDSEIYMERKVSEELDKQDEPVLRGF